MAADTPAHAAFGGEAPAAELPVTDVTDRVVCHHVGSARLVRAGPGADHAVHRECPLDLRGGLEPVVEQVGDAHRQQAGDVRGHPGGDALLTPRQLGEVEQVGRLVGTDVWRYLGEQRTHHLGDALEPCVPPGPRVGVPLGELGDLLVRAGRIVLEDGQRPAFGGEGLVVGPHRMDLVTVAFQAEVGDDGRRHQADDVRQPGDAQVWGRPPTATPWSPPPSETAPGIPAPGSSAPDRARYAAATRPLCPPPTMTAS